LRFLLTAFIAGESLLLFLPQLPSNDVWIRLILVIGSLLLTIYLLKFFKTPALPKIKISLWMIVLFLLGFSWSAYLTHTRLINDLSPELEGVALLVTGVIDGLPHQGDQSLRFSLKVEEVIHEDESIKIDLKEFPNRLSLGWYPGWRGEGVLPDIQPGERWRLPVVLKRAHGLMNPHGFDFERWMFQQNLGATGSVKANAKGLPRSWKPSLLADFHLSFTTFVELTRWHLRERIKRSAPEEAPYVGVLIALVMGEQNAIPQDDWRVFNATGIGHLISISGLHVTMLAGMGAALANRLWRRRSLPMLCATQKVSALSGFLVALIYTWLAGFQIPAQRTMYMVGVVAVALWLGRITRAFDIWWWALFVVLFLDPWAAYTPGFWLSFGAVAAILFAMPGQDGFSEYGYSRSQKWWQSFKEATRVQAVVTIALLPLTLYWFSQFSVVSPLANAFAIPLVSFIVTPFAMLGAVLPSPISDGCLWIAHSCMELVAWFLKPMSSWFWSVAYLPQPSLLFFVISTAGIIYAIRPGPLALTYKSRLLGLCCCLPLLWPKFPVVAHGDFKVTVLDIGQGTAVLVETHRKRLLYDTGPKTSPQSDAGERNVLPFLRGEGISFIDRMVISHKDTDHVGGALSLMKSVTFGDLLGTLPEWHFLVDKARDSQIPALPCQAGQSWWWDGVLFKVWHPGPEMTFASVHHTGKPNAISCVIEVTNGHYSFWLTGDVERGGEAIIANEYKSSNELASILLMPHHGSATSSSQVFLDAIKPQWAVAQAGYRNRYRHPNQKVVERYIEREIPILETIHTGAQIWEFKGKDWSRKDWREIQRRSWHQ
jgi:competence protein ComEC